MGSALARRHIALKNMDFWFLDAYIEKKGSKALVNEVACLNVLPKRQAETKQQTGKHSIRFKNVIYQVVVSLQLLFSHKQRLTFLLT